MQCFGELFEKGNINKWEEGGRHNKAFLIIWTNASTSDFSPIIELSKE